MPKYKVGNQHLVSTQETQSIPIIFTHKNKSWWWLQKITLSLYLQLRTCHIRHNQISQKISTSQILHSLHHHLSQNIHHTHFPTFQRIFTWVTNSNGFNFNNLNGCAGNLCHHQEDRSTNLSCILQSTIDPKAIIKIKRKVPSESIAEGESCDRADSSCIDSSNGDSWCGWSCYRFTFFEEFLAQYCLWWSCGYCHSWCCYRCFQFRSCQARLRRFSGPEGYFSISLIVIIICIMNSDMNSVVCNIIICDSWSPLEH